MPHIVVSCQPTPDIISGCEKGINRLLNRCHWLFKKTWQIKGLIVFALGNKYNFPKYAKAGDGRSMFLAGDIMLDHVAERIGKKEAPHHYTDDQLFNSLFNLLDLKGKESLSGLNGRYSLVIWDEKREELSVASDPFGSRHIYYLYRNSSISLSTNLSILTSHPDFSKSLDPKGAVESLCLGYQIEDRTLFDNIKIIPENSVLTFRHGELQICRGKAFNFYDEYHHIEWDEAAEEFHRLLRESVEKRAQSSEHVIVPLSGGLDSRCMAGLAHEMELTTSFFTYGTKGCDDIKYASKVAASMGTETRIFHNPYDYMVKWWADPFLFNGDCCAPNISVFVDFLEKIGGNRGIFLSGFLGNPISEIAHPAEERIKPYLLPGYIIKSPELFFPIDIISSLLKDPLWTAIVQEIPSGVKRMYDQIDCEPTMKPILLELLTRQRHYTSFQTRLIEMYGGLIVPFEDLDVISFLLQLPLSFRKEQDLYKRLHIKAFPDLSRIPSTTMGGRPLLPTAISLFHEFLEHRFRKFKNHWRVQSVMSRFSEKPPTVNHAAALRHNGAPLLQWILDSKELLEGTFDLEEVSKLVECHLHGNISGTWKILALLHIMQGLQVCSGDVKPPVATRR